MTKNYSKLYVSGYITGGLGNILFQIATVLAYAWKYSLTPIFKNIPSSKYPDMEWQNKVYPRYVYWKNIFKNLTVVNILPSKLKLVKEKGLSYYELPNPKTILSFRQNIKKKKELLSLIVRKNWDILIQKKNRYLWYLLEYGFINSYCSKKKIGGSLQKNYNKELLLLTLRKNKGILLSGFFGSPKYFNKYREKIIQYIFYVDPAEKDYLKNKYEDIFNEKIITIGLHNRRCETVYQTDLWTNLTETEYYQKSITFFEEKFRKSELKFIIFSDDPEWTENYIKTKFAKLNLIFPREKDYLDLYLMSCCNHQIIANSTFSWWAAYLNHYSDKIVIAPKDWFGPKGVQKHDLYMDDWILL